MACRNILIKEEEKRLVAKIADFGILSKLWCNSFTSGLSREVEDFYETESGKIPVKWTGEMWSIHCNLTFVLAPEVFKFNKHSSKSGKLEFQPPDIPQDVWSFGVTMMEIVLNGEMPYPNFDNLTTRQKVLEGYVTAPHLMNLNSYRMPKPETCSQELYDIMMVSTTLQNGLTSAVVLEG